MLVYSAKSRLGVGAERKIDFRLQLDVRKSFESGQLELAETGDAVREERGTFPSSCWRSSRQIKL